MKKFEDYLVQYIDLLNKLDNYDKASNIINNDGYNYNNSVKLGKKIDVIAKKMLAMDMDRFIKLLDCDNMLVRENSAEYLYPFYPNKCINIMQEYANSIEKEVDRIKINSKIKGLKRKDAFFENIYKKLYNVDDLTSLNKEK